MINDYIAKHFDCSLEDLESCDQHDLVKFFAEQHNISTTHGYLVRNSGPEALENPDKFLGDQYGPTVLKLWHHLDNLTPEDFDRIAAAWGAAWNTAWGAARDTARAARGARAARDAAYDATWVAATWGAAAGAAWDAINEIYGQDVMRSKGQEFYFCKMLGFELD